MFDYESALWIFIFLQELWDFGNRLCLVAIFSLVTKAFYFSNGVTTNTITQIQCNANPRNAHGNCLFQ
jgi:hypothetical protein